MTAWGEGSAMGGRIPDRRRSEPGPLGPRALWSIVLPDATRSLAYCLPQSVTPGDRVALHLSADVPAVHVDVVRDGAEPTVVWQRRDVPSRPHAIPDDA